MPSLNKEKAFCFSHLRKLDTFCELAPFRITTVAGFHRAHPSTTLDKSYKYVFEFI